MTDLVLDPASRLLAGSLLVRSRMDSPWHGEVSHQVQGQAATLPQRLARDLLRRGRIEPRGRFGRHGHLHWLQRVSDVQLLGPGELTDPGRVPRGYLEIRVLPRPFVFL